MEALKKNSLKKYQNYKPHGTQIVTRNLQNGPQKLPKWRPKPSKIEPKLGQEGSRTTNKSKNNIDPTKRGGGLPQGPPILEENVANMAPTWVPRWSQNGEKIDAKIDQKFDASWDRFLMRFWWILGGKMEASWHQNGIRNRCYFENAEKPKSIIIPI